MLHGGAELVAPPEPAGLAGPSLYVAANQGPVSGPVSFDESGQNPVFFCAPWAFDPVRFVGITRVVVGL